mmetsp:Transcript_15398/g.62815  ORF Transcript_15398/g.62815 Transcript_15398/m.62815 type:complete len:573 (-) Transcript_15398:1970-3688(-)|eukprot:CAMPEP_0113964180 /NCGR_PEP_ID=MMETSP0011_2-20120614/6978_1 /TAXON_ID=101924 /ORGANISM="Rhodosorus marinus" /LENGTH=572 /DNA_ID=CAMNT_0000976417 /DNA_START=341 /DNA_END=2059 /DNA_ORIENTATION=- /assembly_acc=CAM_ASM_000156
MGAGSYLLNVDSLMGSVESLFWSFVAETYEGLDGTSLVYQYVRRVVVIFDAIQFEGVCALYDETVNYINADFETRIELPKVQSRPSLQQQLKDLPEENFTDAEDAVHRSFDLSLVHVKKSITGSPAEFASGVHYAPLSLAAVQHKFGHKSEAEAALAEAVNIAQQIGNQEFQSLIAPWLAEIHDDWRFLATSGTNYEAELELARKEVETLGLGKPSDERLCRIRKHVAKAIALANNSDQAAVPGFLLLAGAWLLEGGRAVAYSYAQLALRRSSRLDRSLHASAFCAVQSLRFDEGNPEEALDALFAQAKDEDSGSVLVRTTLKLSLELALAKGEIRVAEALLSRASWLDDKDNDCAALLARAECCLVKGDLFEANRLAEELVLQAAQRRLCPFVVEAYLIQAQSHLKAKSVTSALAPVLSALSFANSLRWQPQRCRAVRMLAKIHLFLGEQHEALLKMRQITPVALNALPCRHKGEHYLIHAMCMAECDGHPYEEIAAELNRARTHFEKASCLAGFLDTEILAAKTADQFSKHRERDQAAREARSIAKRIGTAARKLPMTELRRLLSLAAMD